MEEKKNKIEINAGDEILLKHVNVISEEDTISLADLAITIWRWKFLILLLTILGLVFGFSASNFIEGSESEVMTISELRWEGITEGEYPDGRRFIANEMFSANNYALVIQNSNLNTSIDNLRSNISIEPIIPARTLTQIDNALRQGQQLSFHPTLFNIKVNHSGLGVDVAAAQNILNLLINQFEADFEQRYIQQTIDLNLLNLRTENLEYFQILEGLETQIHLIDEIILDITENSSTRFVSSTLGFGFSNIRFRTQSLRQSSINSMQSIYEDFLISKDQEKLESIYRLRLNQLAESIEADRDIEQGLISIIDNYVGGTSTIIIPGITDSLTIEQDTFIDTLYERLLETQERLAHNRQLERRYSVQFERLNNLNITPIEQQRQITLFEEELSFTLLTLNSITQDLEILAN